MEAYRKTQWKQKKAWIVAWYNLIWTKFIKRKKLGKPLKEKEPSRT